MSFRVALSVAILGLWALVAPAAPIVEIVNQAGPHGTAPREWLQRLANAGAGPTRVVSSGTAEPRLEDLGTSSRGTPLVKVHAVLTRRNELILPGEGGRPERFRLSNQEKLANYFRRLAKGGAEEITVERGKYGLTQAEFTDLFTRLSAPMPALAKDATLRQAINTVEQSAKLSITIAPEVATVVKRTPVDASSVEQVATGTALAALLRQEALAMRGSDQGSLRVVPMSEVSDPWTVGYKPERSPSRTAPALMEFLTVEVEGYTLQEAFDAITPRLKWKDRPLPILWDHYAMRSAAIDPATIDVRFPRKRTFYKKLLDQLAIQARLKVDLRVDEAGAPLIWMTR